MSLDIASDFPIDWTAPVDRWEIGSRVAWDMGDARPRTGEIVYLSNGDATYCMSGEAKDLFAPWGTYFGRRARVRCDRSDCVCQSGKWLHHCNECQFSPADVLSPVHEGMLF